MMNLLKLIQPEFRAHRPQNAKLPLSFFLAGMLLLGFGLVAPENSLAQTSVVKPFLECVDTVTVPKYFSLHAAASAGDDSIVIKGSTTIDGYVPPEKKFVFATIDPGGPNEETVVVINKPSNSTIVTMSVTGLSRNHNAGEQIRVEVEQRVAFFGYESSDSKTVTIKIGEPRNFFNPLPEVRGQPEQFLPGLRRSSFASLWDHVKQPTLTWFLDNQPATASLGSPPCTKSTSGITLKGPWDPTAPYVANDVVSYLGSSWIARRDSLNVLPAEGDDWMLLVGVGDSGPQGPKGDTGATGTIGPVGPQGPAGPMGSLGLQGPAGPMGSLGLQGPAGPMGPLGPQGIQGLQGIRGLQGPPGPSGNNALTASQVYTFPKSCSLTITDTNVTANSMITLQYVGGNTFSEPPVATKIKAGKFTAEGIANKQFRYIVIN